MEKGEEEGDKALFKLTETYRKQIEKELQDICSDILDLLDKHLIPSATVAEGEGSNEVNEAYVFYYKM